MRIIAGRWGSRPLAAPAGRGTRPITDRIKQGLFDWLGQDLAGVAMADICAGSGAIAFEAASRGAAPVHAIESDPAALAVLRANHAALSAGAAVVIHARPFAAVLPGLRDLDLAICDPPFPWYREAPEQLAAMLALAAAALRPGGSLLVRGDAGTDLPALAGGLREHERRTWGRSWIAWLRTADHQPGA